MDAKEWNWRGGKSRTFGDQARNKCIRMVAERRQFLCLKRYDLARFLVERLIDSGGIRLRKLALSFEAVKQCRHYSRPRGLKPHYAIDMKMLVTEAN